MAIATPFRMFDPPTSRHIAVSYREGFPALKLTSVRAAWRRGVRHAEWHDQEDRLVARISLTAMADDNLDMVTEWIIGGMPQTRRDILLLNKRLTTTRKMTPTAMCQGCERMRSTLYLVEGIWRCTECAELDTRATLLTPAEKLLVRARGLAGKVDGRAPPHRGYTTFDRQRMTLQYLRAKLAALGMTILREEMRPCVRIEWIDDERDISEDGLAPTRYQGPIEPAPTIQIPLLDKISTWRRF